MSIKNFELSDSNKAEGLYQFIITFTNETKSRIFYTNQPTWKPLSITRLLNKPCSICYKDYYCSCLDKYIEDIHQEISDKGLFAAAVTE
ncbi:hypothetical protein [Paenibacillus sp. CECT 9249]|uniref:hypothetical protein n=1 Tax=Paenibacillus sp. CECT 9249 TaxID=2845385 RepID=UPI001E53F217|nr:hypothetical protein [Paenibacillus sp. CECT 9249]